MFGRNNEGGHLATFKKAKTAGNHKLLGSDHLTGFMRYEHNLGRPVNLTVLPLPTHYGKMPFQSEHSTQSH